MPTRPRTLRMTAGERLAAGYVTGPVGHFVAGSIDLALAVGRLLVARGRRARRARAGGLIAAAAGALSGSANRSATRRGRP